MENKLLISIDKISINIKRWWQINNEPHTSIYASDVCPLTHMSWVPPAWYEQLLCLHNTYIHSALILYGKTKGLRLIMQQFLFLLAEATKKLHNNLVYNYLKFSLAQWEAGSQSLHLWSYNARFLQNTTRNC